MDDYATASGVEIAAARRRLRMSPTAAARIAGISPMTWKRIEEGESVRETSLAAARYAVGLDGNEGKPPPESVDLSELDDDDLIAELCRRLKDRRRPAPRGTTLLHQAEGQAVGQRSAARPGKRP